MRIPASRPRIIYAISAAATIAVGLAVHLGGTGLPRDLRDIIGDTLWASMMVWWVGALLPHAPLVARAAMAYLICVAVELSQLVHTPMLDAARATVAGRLVLGSGFDARDLLAYLLGVCLAALSERAIRVRR